MTNEQLFTEIMIEFTKLNARLDSIEKTVDSPYRVVSIPPSVKHMDLASFSEQLESSFITIADSQNGIWFNNGQDTCN